MKLIVDLDVLMLVIGISFVLGILTAVLVEAKLRARKG